MDCTLGEAALRPGRVLFASTLVLSINACVAKTPSPPTNIRSLFSVPAGTQLDYPPTDVPGPYPREPWIAAYQKAKVCNLAQIHAGLIPSLPQSQDEDGSAVYPASYRGHICNPGLNRCNSSVDVISAPAGRAGISYAKTSTSLLIAVLTMDPSLPQCHCLNTSSHNLKKPLISLWVPFPAFTLTLSLTRFSFSNPDTFQAIDKAEHHLAVHTYSRSHFLIYLLFVFEKHLIVGELGWTMQLIHDRSRKGVICAHWRPPYGELASDIDQRVQAIAKHVFGLKSILWLYDPRGKHPPVLSDVIPSRLIPHAYSAFVDWCLADSTPNASACAPGDGPQNLAELQNTLKVFVNSPKEQVSLNFTPCILAPPVKPIGLMILEHEQSTRAVAAFKFIYPIMKKLKWITLAIPDALRLPWYQ
ncbi:uncharacterized protein VP01_1598g7 [Puccinia sorghi]|uniref:Uncharacterized protein n=1 Tax=Puccinia sorghi TaxID=27349 RepID=A0A0L6VHZ2_9BASI|nr:uncharacterized protein VP01_1598g7 [Puccinia sorghi]